jgi:hypothetical protein
MSVTTTADEKVDDALGHARAAATCLAAILVDECWGYDEYNAQFMTRLQESMTMLIKVKNKLSRGA